MTNSKKFSQEQYDLLKKCSNKKDMTEWNQWRKKNPDEKILLEGAYLEQAYLEYTNLQGAYLIQAKLQGANLQVAELQEADLQGAKLRGADLQWAKLQGADLQMAELQEADLLGADLQGADFRGADLQMANLQGDDLQMAKLQGAKLRGVDLQLAKLQGAELQGADLQGADLLYCYVDKNTDFSDVGLSTFLISDKNKQQLAKNIRRIGWEKWYKSGPWYSSIVNFFWWTSDYGTKTTRLFWVFLVLSVIFALIYWLFAYIDYEVLNTKVKDNPGIISNLIPVEKKGDIEEKEDSCIIFWTDHNFSHYLFTYDQANISKTIPIKNSPIFIFDTLGFGYKWGIVALRSFYFSIVTMTTLGFGDMYAKPFGKDSCKDIIYSICGHILLIFHVLFGYFLLGALITRLSILFSSEGGPEELK